MQAVSGVPTINTHTLMLVWGLFLWDFFFMLLIYFIINHNQIAAFAIFTNLTYKYKVQTATYISYFITRAGMYLMEKS